MVNITFGTSNNSNSGVTTPGYTFVNSSCPNDGFYSVTRSTANCFGNSWHTIPEDHTGNGAFMLVNASYDPGDFFVTTVTGLCPNTIYEFAAWIMNVINTAGAIEPNITFKIETPSGIIINQFNTGSISSTSSPQWKQYGFFFTTTAGNPDIILRMTNNAPGGIGNDVALDDITFRPCGPVLTTAVAGNTDLINVCEINQEVYSFTSNLSAGFVSPAYQWQVSQDESITWVDIPGANSSVFLRNPTSAGKYAYRLTVSENGNAGISACRIASKKHIVNVHGVPSVNAGGDRILIKGDQVTLTASAVGDDLTYAWTPTDNLSSGVVLNPIVTAENDITYTLKVTSVYGCFNEDALNVKVINGLFVPNAFTPDGNSKNDYWRIPYLDPFSSTVTVYNRYGQVVYRSADATLGWPTAWDGKYKGREQPAGIYIYIIRFSNNPRILSGTLTLIR